MASVPSAWVVTWGIGSGFRAPAVSWCCFGATAVPIFGGMSSSAPPPPAIAPPPSPEVLLGAGSSTKIARNVRLDGCLWAMKNPEVQKACYLSNVCTSSPPKCCRFKNIPAILQDGPTCGLTALSMVFNGNPSPLEFLSEAKRRNYTFNGEMFSAENLFQLICDYAKEKSVPVECQLYEGRLNCAKVKEHLRNDACIFVPYDPDFNHGPCLKLGHKAHWALLIGYLIDPNDQFYVLSRHGKTRNIAVWSLKLLSSSNSNLLEFEQPKGYPHTDFLLPDGGIGGEHGLRNRAIIVKGLQAETIDLV